MGGGSGRKIGVFDSGVGGLTVLEHLVRALPEHDFDYFGDVGRAPYGSRSRATIAHFTEQGVNFLFDQGASLVIIACNTACAVSLHYLQTKYLRAPGVTERKILGIVVPTVEAAMGLTTSGHVGLLGTEATIGAQTYERELEKRDAQVVVRGVSCPVLVPLVEAGWEDTEVARLACARYVEGLADPRIDTVILGCTHYPFLRRRFEQTLPPGVRLVEQGPVVAERTVTYLARHPEIAGQLGRGGQVRFFTSDEPEHFAHIGSKYYGAPIADVRRVTEVPKPPQERHHALELGDDEDFQMATPYAWQGRDESRRI